MATPFYDPTKTYDENYKNGPFGAFADDNFYQQTGEPTINFLGQKVYLPFGIPAGPLINSNFCKAAFDKGFDICVYKTVRSSIFPCHAFPNILGIHPNGDLTLAKLQKPIVADTNYSPPLSITNSFGVPSKDPDVWQEDVKKAISYAGRGQVLILSFMGTVRDGQSEQEFIDDFSKAGKLSFETKAKVLEVNLSCPNIGNEGLVCYNLEMTKKIVSGIRKKIGNTPLVLKVGYYSDYEQLKKLAKIAHEYANGVSGINTLPGTIVDKFGNQALPGKNRLIGGICGAGIKWAGLDFVRKLKEIKDSHNYSFEIEGVGGVTVADDYFEYKEAGADVVMSATGAMWNPHLAQEIKKKTRYNE